MEFEPVEIQELQGTLYGAVLASLAVQRQKHDVGPAISQLSQHVRARRVHELHAAEPGLSKSYDRIATRGKRHLALM